MKPKLSTLLILASCFATAVLVHSQPARRGISLIAVRTESEAVALRLRIQSGASFEAIAMTYSTDPSAARAGYLGLVDESSVSRELQAALKKLLPGDTSAVTRVDGRFVLLKVTTPEEDRCRSQLDDAARALQNGRYAEAASLFSDAAQQAEKFGAQDVRLAESLNGLAQAYRYQQNHTAAEPRARHALAILERAIGPSHPAVLPSLIHLAAITTAKDRYAEAEQMYRRILSLRWGAYEVLENFAEVLSLNLMRDAGLESALEQFWKSVSDARLNKDLYIAMRDGFVAAKLLEEAEFLMQRVVRANPDSRQLQFELGELYAIWGKYTEAIEAFESANRRGEIGAERRQRGLIYERIAEMNISLVRFDPAIAALTKALEFNPEGWSSRLLLGSVYLRRNKFDEAAAQYSRVISIDPRIAAAHEGLAQVQLELGRYMESAKEAEAALAADPALQSSRYIKAMALIRGGNEREGRIALQDYQQQERERQIATSVLNGIAERDKTAMALLSEGQAEQAMAMLKEGIREHPLNAGLYLKLGLVQSRLGLHREAAETFEAIVRLQLDDFLVHRQLAREYEALGDNEGAQKQRAIYLQRYDAALQAKAKS